MLDGAGRLVRRDGSAAFERSGAGAHGQCPAPQVPETIAQSELFVCFAQFGVGLAALRPGLLAPWR